VANYSGGSVAVLPVLPDGRLGNARTLRVLQAKSAPAKATSAPLGSHAFSGHDRTHAHMIQADPAGRFVLHVDLGLDKIFVWKFDEQVGVLTPNEPPAVSLPAGDGPRHFHFHPNGRWFYSIQEEGSTIVCLTTMPARGGWLLAHCLHAAAQVCRQQFLLRDFRCGRWAIRLCGQPAARQHRDLFRWPPRQPHVRRRRMDERELSAQLQLRPHRQVPLCCNQRGDNIAVSR